MNQYEPINTDFKRHLLLKRGQEFIEITACMLHLSPNERTKLFQYWWNISGAHYFYSYNPEEIES